MMEVVTAKSPYIEKAEEKEGAVYFYSEQGVLRILPQKGGVIRVSFGEDGSFPEAQGGEYREERGSIPFRLVETETELCLATEEGTVKVSRESGAIAFYGAEGKLLLQERRKDPRQLEKITLYRSVPSDKLQVEEIKTADGVKKKVKAVEKEVYGEAYKTRTYFSFDDNEVLLGLGQGEHGEWNLRHSTYYVHQGNRKIGIPLLVSSKAYGILLSTQSLCLFHEDEDSAFLQTEADQYLDYFFLLGDDLPQVIRNFRHLTGKAAMLPQWAFGYMQSKERYLSQEDILATAQEFRKRQIGVDSIVLDWLSWEDGMWGQKSFDPARFPNPKAMVDALHEMGIHFMMSIWPNMSPGTENRKEFEERGLLFPGTDIYDAFSKEGRELYWSQVKRALYPAGVDAWWCDSSEPIAPEWEHVIEPSDGEKYCEYKYDAAEIMPFELANAFGKYHARAIWDGQRGCSLEKRVVNLTRSGWAGSQSYGTILWSGDTSASWKCLENQIHAGLQMAASGMPYWTMDTGAFFVKKGRIWYWNGEYEEGITDAYKRLYVRWFWFAAFLPIFRAHGTDVEREPWAFGDKGSVYYDSICKAIETRYRLMPYIYSVAASVCREDAMFLRPLVFAYGQDEAVSHIKDQYMFGPSMMICPIYEDTDTREIYLPKGSGWYDFETGKHYEGGQTICYSCGLDRIPIFVPEGAIIPTKQPGLNTEAMSEEEIEILVYPGADGVFFLYTDAGDGYGFENGEYCVTEFTWKDKEKKFYSTCEGNENFKCKSFHKRLGV